MTDAKVYEVAIVLAGDQQRTLTSAEGKAVLDQFELVRREARRWQAKTGHTGRLIIIEPKLISEIEAFLDATVGDASADQP